jgi:hypothetical protein
MATSRLSLAPVGALHRDNDVAAERRDDAVVAMDEGGIICIACNLITLYLPSMPSHPIKDPVTWLYPAIEPYNTGRLQVSPIHELYYEESGNPDGKPAVFLHGGPGGGSDPKQCRFFHPDKYRIVNFDQRGCGKSTPYASLDANTT